MTDYRVTLKSNVQSVELNKKKVKVNCYNNKSGNLAVTTLNQNSSLFGGHSYDINKGIDGAKDFNVKFEDKDHAEQFKNAIQAILDDASIVPEAPEKSGIDNLKEKAGDILDRATDVFLGPAETETPGDAPDNAPAGDAPAGGGNGGNGGGDDDSGNKTMLYVGIGGAVLLVLVLVLVLWKKK